MSRPKGIPNKKTIEKKEIPIEPVKIKSSEPQEGTQEWFLMMAERNKEQMLQAKNDNDVKAFQSLEEHYRTLAEQAN